MIYFTPEYLQFFENLAGNNNKQWFDENRKTYESVVREPFKYFIGELIKVIRQIDEEINIEPKNAIFRINRDVRFSKDKTPYKLFNSAIISKNGRKDKTYPGLYLELNPEKLSIFGGVYRPSTQEIIKIRHFIMEHPKRFKTLVNEKHFTNVFGEIKGLKNKRLQKEFREAATKQSLLWNKQWYYEMSLPPEIIVQDDLLEIIVQQYRIAYKMQHFFIDALYY